MAGIGKYTKGKKFQLKSGNKPSGFKMMGSSPANYKQEDSGKSEEELKAQVNVTNTNADKVVKSLGKPASPARQEEEGKGKKILKKVGNTLVGAFTSGLDAVYGSGKVMPGDKVKFNDPKDEDEKEEKEFGTTALDNDEK